MKGVLFTACLTILALVVLTTSFLFYQQGLEEQGSMARLALFDRMADEYVAAEKGLREIINTSGITGINISVNGSTVTITEPLPNNSSFTFEGNASGWKEFVENTSDFSLEVNISDITKDLSIYIDGAKYYHQPKIGGNNIRMINAGNVTNYSVTLDIDADGNISVIKDMGPPGPNSFDLIITTNTDSYSNSWDNLRFDKSNEFEIIISDGQTYEISMNIGSPDLDKYGWLKIDNEDNVDMIVTTDITLDTEPTVNFLKQSINITESQYNISRLSSVKIV